MNLDNIGKSEETKGLLSLLAKERGMKFKTVCFNCPVHGEQVYEVPETSTKEPRCPICKLEEKARLQRLEEAKAESRIRERDLTTLLHPSQGGNDLSTFKAYFPETEGAEKALAITRRFAKNFTIREGERIEAENSMKPDAKKKNAVGLLLYGNSGCGKTHLANAIVEDLHEQGWGVLMMTAQELVYGYSTIYHYDEKGRVLRALSMIPVLIIDEVGRQRNEDKDGAFFWQVFNERVRLGRPTILITNFSGDELKTAFDDSVIDRMRSATYPLLFDWKSHRKTVSKSVDPLKLF